MNALVHVAAGALGHRCAARGRSADQLLRPDQPLCWRTAAVTGIWSERWRIRLAVQRFLLVLALLQIPTGMILETDPVWAIIWISLALSGLAAAAPVGWSIPSLIAPRGGTGTISGIMNFLNNMMGVVAPLATGYIVGATGSFVGAFLTAGIVLAIGIGAYVFILGRLEPIADPPVA